MDLDTAISEYAETRTVHGMDILVGTATLSGQMPTANAQQALLPQRKEIDLSNALSHLLSQPAGPSLPPPAAPDEFEPSVVLSEPAYDEWTLDACIKHANNNFDTINVLISNTNNTFKTLYTMTLDDLRRAVNDIDRKHADATKSFQQQVDTMGVQLDLVQWSSSSFIVCDIVKDFLARITSDRLLLQPELCEYQSNVRPIWYCLHGRFNVRVSVLRPFLLIDPTQRLSSCQPPNTLPNMQRMLGLKNHLLMK